MSSLWIGFERVVEREPKSRPWKAVLNDRMDMLFGEPGDWLFMEDEISSAVKSTSGPPRC